MEAIVASSKPSIVWIITTFDVYWTSFAKQCVNVVAFSFPITAMQIIVPPLLPLTLVTAHA
jgi:hypothetical protein